MIRNIMKWISYSLASIFFGCFFGFCLAIGWFFFRWIILGYGDSGPSWSNTVMNICIYGGPIIGTIAVEILFIIYGGKGLLAKIIRFKDWMLRI